MEMKMKKTIATIFTLALTFTLAACGGSSSGSNEANSGGTNRNSDAADTTTSNAEAAATTTPEQAADSEPTPAPLPEWETVEFGNHEWLVLDEQDGKTLLLTKYVLYNSMFDLSGEDTTWETSDLRDHLNSDFLNGDSQYYGGFSDDERARIMDTTVVTNNNLWNDTPGGGNTTDKIFLLSVEEVLQYFGGSELDLPSQPYFMDQYDEGRRAYDSDGKACWWWLRSTGTYGTQHAVINSAGAMSANGNNDANRYGVRPAMWVNL